MSPETSNVIVEQGPTAGSVQVHHHDFPEIRSHGETPAAAATHLANQLTRALDTALTHWRRDSIQRAIEDVQSFSKTGRS
jgi:hypothetical protein